MFSSISVQSDFNSYEREKCGHYPLNDRGGNTLPAFGGFLLEGHKRFLQLVQLLVYLVQTIVDELQRGITV